MRYSQSPFASAPIALPDDWLGALLPFHIAVDAQGRIVQCGDILAGFLPSNAVETHLLDLFEIERPAHGNTPASAEREDWTEVEADRLWILKHRRSALRIKGAWQVFGPHALMLANMWVSSLGELATLGLSISDFPVHELAGDHLLMMQQQATSLKDMRELSDSLALARDAAQDASRAKSSFLASMSHEIRTPMNGVMGLTEALKDTGLNPEQRELVSVIEKSSHHLLQIISDILDFSKVEAGQLQLVSKPTNLTQLLQEVVEVYRSAAEEKDVGLELSICATLPAWVELDATRLRQVIFNLVSNAIKFTPPNGEVLVAVSYVQKQLTVVVKDSGLGLTQNEIEQIFDPFKQADEGASRGSAGTGLGLSISKQIVHRMNGSLEVSSEVGVGSEFSISILLDECAAPPQPTSRTYVQFKGSVLVVDDNPVNLMVASRMFRKLGCEVAQADSGKRAVSTFSNHQAPFDVVFMDCHMPGLDGFEATRQIRQIDQRTPIIALTADVFEDARDSCFDAGMNDVLTKPMSIKKVSQILSQYLLRTDDSSAG